MVTSDPHKALFGYNYLGCITIMPVASCIPSLFLAPCDGMLAMLVCATRWLYMHLYTFAYMSMHESYLLVCRPGFNTMKLWTFNPNLHCPSRTPLFVHFLTCLLSLLFACFLAMLVVPIMLICFVPFICLLHLFLPLLVCWFLVFAFACTHMERGRMELGHSLPGVSKKGTDASM